MGVDEQLPATVQRVQTLINYLIQDMKAGNDPKGRQFQKILTMILEDASEELRDANPAALEYYFQRSAGMFYWAATGDKPMDVPWPEDFVIPDHLKSIPPRAEVEIPAIEATPENKAAGEQRTLDDIAEVEAAV